MAENPGRLVIDIDGLELSPALRDLVGKVRSDDPFIAGVRAGQNMPRVVRLMALAQTPATRAEVQHVYLRGAAALRRDIAQ